MDKESILKFIKSEVSKSPTLIPFNYNKIQIYDQTSHDQETSLKLVLCDEYNTPFYLCDTFYKPISQL